MRELEGKEVKAFALVEEIPVGGKLLIESVDVKGGKFFVDAAVIGDKLLSALRRTKTIYFDRNGRIYEGQISFSSGEFISFTGVRPSPVGNRQTLRVAVPLTERKCKVKFFHPEEKEVEAYLADISTSGAGIKIPEKIFPVYGDEIVLTWEPVRIRGKFVIPLKVVNVMNGEDYVRIGGVFSGVSPKTVDRIARYVALRQKEVAQSL